MENSRDTFFQDDMDDSPEITQLEKHQSANRLIRVLTCCSTVIEPAFRDADEEVGLAKAAYMKLAILAALMGGLAVIFGIIQLSDVVAGNMLAPYLPWVEFAFAVVAVGVAIRGLAGRKQEKWFVARYRAERLRLLKFDFLTRYPLWSEDAPAAESCCQSLDAEVEEVAVSSYATLTCWMNQGTLPKVLTAPSLPPEEWSSLRDLYRNKRLLGQIHYLAGAIERNSDRNDKTRTLPSVLFFGSVAFVLAHICIGLVGSPAAPVAKIVMILAASLPACGAGIRVIRGVLEYARNASRYEATHNVLLKLSKRLREATDSPTVYREIGFCEQILTADLREWLRLMVEAEWFG